MDTLGLETPELSLSPSQADVHNSTTSQSGYNIAGEHSNIESRRNANGLTPPCSLPSELLARVFTLGQEAQRDIVEETDDFDYQRFEVLMSHVCSHFRDIAIGTPLLWSEINITPELSNAEMEVYLERSSGCELAVRIETNPFFSVNAPTMEKIQVIAPHVTRCRQLIINSVYESSMPPIIRLFYNVSMPSLKHLSLSIDKVDRSFVSTMPLGRSAPQLTFVRLRGIALVLFRPSLDNITTLHLDQTVIIPIPYPTFRRFLTSSPTLRNLSVYGDLINTAHTQWPGLEDPIYIPTLRCLRICGMGGDIYSGLLLGIAAPALASVVLKDVKHRDLWRFFTSPLSSFKFPLLRKLTLIDSELRVDEYNEMFNAFPSITSFSIYHRETPAILRLLSEAPVDGNVRWPALTTLALVVDDNNEYVIDDIVRRRQSLGHPLSTMRLGTSEHLSTLQYFDWLSKNVTLESFLTFDRWPDLEEDLWDLDDTLFQ